MLTLYVLLFLIILLLIYMNIEARNVKVEHIKFTKNENHLKIMQISDIHIYYLMVSTRKIKQIICREKPDFIVLTGDYISKPKQIPDFLKLIRNIKGSHKIFACLGNHEYNAFHKDREGLQKFVNQMTDLGITVLQDSSCRFEKNSRIYSITGFNDVKYRSHDITTGINSIIPQASVVLALSHNPDIIYELPPKKIDYLFSGHFHGGQIWAPFNIELKLMRSEKLCKLGINQGLHKINNINLYISRGIGNVCFPFRFLSRPEITLFYIP